MANEFNIVASLKLANGSLKYANQVTAFRADQTTRKGPTPGTIAATTSGVEVSLAALTTPGFAVIQNTDTTNYVQYGLYVSTTFYPLGELLPGEVNIVRLARDILTANGAAAKLYLKANTATCNVLVQAFDK